MAKKGKNNKGGPEAKRGAPDHFRGFKRQFLESRAIIYQQALDSKGNKTSEFYDKVTRDFILKYGDTKPFEAEPEEDPPIPLDNAVVEDFEDQDLAAATTKRFSKLRTVSNF
jgi:hypothetical protein